MPLSRVPVGRLAVEQRASPLPLAPGRADQEIVPPVAVEVAGRGDRVAGLVAGGRSR